MQDVIPIRRIWSDGIFLVGNRFAKTFKFTDINYMVASQESQKNLFLTYAALINSLDCSATTKITLNNHHLNRKNFESTVLMKLRGDALDGYRQEYNDVIMEKGTGGSGIVQEKYVTVSVCKKSVEDARAYFTRAGAELTARFSALGARVTELDATEKLRLLHDFYRSDEEVYFHFDMQDMMRKGHDFRDYICPDSIEKHSDYLMLGGKYARVIYLKDYASFISDQLVTKLTDQSRSMMLSIDIIPVATDEAVREVERKMLGVETNITNWQRRQNANNNFSAIVPYDMEQQRRETKEYIYLVNNDQFPRESSCEVGTFLNQPTTGFVGAATLASRLKLSVLYMGMVNDRRGHYSIRFERICDDASLMTPEEITRRYYDLLEKDIKETPHNWLWSHKRWKNIK